MPVQTLLVINVKTQTPNIYALGLVFFAYECHSYTDTILVHKD